MRARIVVALGLALSACNSYYIYACTDDASCDVSGVAGECISGGAGESYCAFPTANLLCTSRLEWDTSAPPPLASQCVVLPTPDAGP